MFPPAVAIRAIVSTGFCIFAFPPQPGTQGKTENRAFFWSFEVAREEKVWTFISERFLEGAGFTNKKKVLIYASPEPIRWFREVGGWEFGVVWVRRPLKP